MEPKQGSCPALDSVVGDAAVREWLDKDYLWLPCPLGCLLKET